MAKLAFLQGSCALLGARNGSFSAFWHYKISESNERFLKALEVKLHFPSPCLDASKRTVLLEFIA